MPKPAHSPKKAKVTTGVVLPLLNKDGKGKTSSIETGKQILANAIKHLDPNFANHIIKQTPTQWRNNYPNLQIGVLEMSAKSHQVYKIYIYYIYTC